MYLRLPCYVCWMGIGGWVCVGGERIREVCVVCGGCMEGGWTRGGMTVSVYSMDSCVCVSLPMYLHEGDDETDAGHEEAELGVVPVVLDDV